MLFELAMIRMLKDSGNNPSVAKCVYVAPTKVGQHSVESFLLRMLYFQALCAEKFNEWTKKFSGLGITCRSLQLAQFIVNNRRRRLRTYGGYCRVWDESVGGRQKILRNVSTAFFADYQLG